MNDLYLKVFFDFGAFLACPLKSSRVSSPKRGLEGGQGAGGSRAGMPS